MTRGDRPRARVGPAGGTRRNRRSGRRHAPARAASRTSGD
jgi:hypothetical protein